MTTLTALGIFAGYLLIYAAVTDPHTGLATNPWAALLPGTATPASSSSGAPA